MANIALVTNSGINTLAAASSTNLVVNVTSPNLLAVAFQAAGNFGFNAPIYNGSGGTVMTQLAGINATTREAYMHYYFNPNTGNINFYFNNTGSQTVYILVALFSNVNGSSVVAGSNTNSGGAGTSPNVTVSHTYEAGQLGLAAVGMRFAVGFGTTNLTLLGSNNQARFGYRTAETDGTTLLNTNTSSDVDWAIAGGVLNVAPPAGGSNIAWW